MVEPLNRETVGLAPIGETNEDIFVRTGQNQQPIAVTLALPDGADFTQRGSDVTGNFSRLDGVPSDLVLITDGFSIDEAEAMLTEHAQRFGLEVDKIEHWAVSSADFIAANEFGRERLFLDGTPMGYLDVSVEAVANASSDDARIYWKFYWDAPT